MDTNNNNGEFEKILADVFDVLKDSKIPTTIKNEIQKELQQIKSFALDARAPRIAIVGRRGSGKSSLINAIFNGYKAQTGDVKAQTGKGTWHTYKSELGDLEILDTRGLGESDIPEEEIDAKTPIEELELEVRRKCPDVILFLCKAKEVGARIDEDIAQIKELLTVVKTVHNYDVTLVGVVTQIDELQPKKDEPPFLSLIKQKNIQEATGELSRKLKDITSFDNVQVIPTCAYMEFEEKTNEIIDKTVWNVDELLIYLIEQLPNEAQLQLAKLSQMRTVQKNLARKYGKRYAALCGAVGAAPIPLADMPIITGLQTTMIMIIAAISGRKLDKQAVLDFLSAMGVSVGLGYALRQVARQLTKLIPGYGSVISGTIASAGTYALCESSIAYFIEGTSLENVKKKYDEEFEKRKDEE